MLRVAALQTPHAATWEAARDHAARLVDAARAQGVELAVLPEYFFAGMGAGLPEAAEVRRFLEEASHGLAVAANVREAGRNVGVVYVGGRSVLEQAKLHPMPREADEGVSGADGFRAGDVLGHRTAMVVCADILFPEVARMAQLQGARLLLNPVLSSYLPDDPSKEARECLFVARAYDAQAFVVKAGGFLPGRIVGRSLVAAPWGLLAHYRAEDAEEVLVADLDLDRLEAFRRGQARFPPRRPAAYRPLVEEPE